MKTKYIEIAALLSVLIIEETTNMYKFLEAEEAAGRRNATDPEGKGEDLAKKIDRLEMIQADIQAMAAGFNRSPRGLEAEKSSSDPISGLIDSLVQSILVKKPGKNGDQKAPPSENKAERAAYDAAKRDAGAGASVGGSQADFRTAG